MAVQVRNGICTRDEEWVLFALHNKARRCIIQFNVILTLELTGGELNFHQSDCMSYAWLRM